MWPDNETTNDLIGFQVHADLIRGVVSNPKMLPTTIGVFGDWAAGRRASLFFLMAPRPPRIGRKLRKSERSTRRLTTANCACTC